MRHIESELRCLCCCMLHLEYGLNKEPFGVPVVADHPQHFADDTATRLTLDMDDEIDGFSDLRFDIGECRLGVAAHDEIGEAMEGLFR